MATSGPKPLPDFTESDIDKIRVMAGYGLNLEQIAAVMGIGVRLFRKRRNNPIVSAAIEHGKAKAQMIVGKSLFGAAKEGDIGAIRWWEMTRAGRRATQPVGDDGTTTVTTKIILERPDED